MCAEETDLSCINPLEEPPMGDCYLDRIKREFGHKLSLMGNLAHDQYHALGQPLPRSSAQHARPSTMRARVGDLSSPRGTNAGAILRTRTYSRWCECAKRTGDIPSRTDGEASPSHRRRKRSRRVAAKPAVSVRKMRGPREMGRTPQLAAASNSSSVKPPSGPMKEMDFGGPGGRERTRPDPKAWPLAGERRSNATACGQGLTSLAPASDGQDEGQWARPDCSAASVTIWDQRSQTSGGNSLRVLDKAASGKQGHKGSHTQLGAFLREPSRTCASRVRAW